MATGTQEQIEKARQSSALATTENQIAINYGQRTEVRELVQRIRAGLPGSDRVPDAGILALAQAAFAHDLDPWNGEVWCIFNEKRQETSIMAGIKGWRKVAKRQLPDREHYYVDFQPVLPGSDDWKRYGLDQKDNYSRDVKRAEICILRRTDQMSRYIEQLDKLKAVTGTYDEARALAGNPPRYIGIGIVRAGENSKMEESQLVQKRAEQDALKKAFDLPFADRAPQAVDSKPVLVGRMDNEEVIDVDYSATPSVEPTRVITQDGEIVDVPASIVPAKRPWTPEQFVREIGIMTAAKKGVIHADEKIDDGGLRHLMGNVFKPTFGNVEETRHILLRSLFGVEHTNELSNVHKWALTEWAKDAQSAKREVEDFLASPYAQAA